MLFHLLIVDDEPAIRKGLSSFIAWESMNCIVDNTAGSGLEAMEMIREKQPHIVITDIKMPQVDGLALSKFLYENYPSIKIIILTGFADFEYAKLAVKYQVTDFILKPTSKEKLIEAVKQAQNYIMQEKTKNSVLEEDIIFIQEQLLLELTNSERTVPPTIMSRLNTYNIHIGYYFLAAFQLISGESQDMGDMGNSFRALLRSQSQIAYSCRYNQNLFLALFPAEEALKGAGAPAPVIIKTCMEIAEITKTLYSFQLSIGLSLCHNELTSLPSACNQAITALSMNFYSNDNLSVYKKHSEHDNFDLGLKNTILLNEIENLLQHRDFKNLNCQINKLFTQFHLKLVDSQEVKNVCIHIYYVCSRILISKNATSLSPSILEDIHNCSTIFNMERIIHELLDFIQKELVIGRKNLSPIVEKTISIIHTYLQNDLSLETIADHVHTNPSHLSRTFKRECGQSITDYINQVKIEKAQELLTCTNLMAYEIAEKVGFHDPTYFSSTFKKYTGMSPKEYKQLHGK